VRRTLTPQLIERNDTSLLLVDLGGGQDRLGGSCLAQVYGRLGDVPPDLDDPELLKGFFAAIRRLRDAGALLAYHDRSDGGVAVTALEMAFAGNLGLDVALEGLLGVYSGPAAGLVAIAYAGRVVGGRLAPSDEAEEAALFRPRELPPQPATHAGTPKDIWFLSVVRDLLGALERRPDHDPDEPDRALFREM